MYLLESKPTAFSDPLDSWIPKLDQSLRDNGMTGVCVARHAEQPQHFCLWQNTYMMVTEEMSFSAPEGHRVREMLEKTQKETPEGVFWHRGHLTFMGMKPN